MPEDIKGKSSISCDKFSIELFTFVRAAREAAISISACPVSVPPRCDLTICSDISGILFRLK